jgi:hypothetical protein
MTNGLLAPKNLNATEGSRQQEFLQSLPLEYCSAKDHLRIDESLNFIKQKLSKRREIGQAQRVERFQSPVDLPYKESYVGF